MTNRAEPAKRAAFTLIEMMVVVAIIGILIAGVFRLMGAAGESNKKALTVARMQKLQNALSGYYAEYGNYPPVRISDDPRAADPFMKWDEGSFDYTQASTLTTENANRAAGCQPIAFEYPSPDDADLNEYINRRYESQQARNVNEVLGAVADSPTLGSDWPKARIFKFGVLSHLLPRVELMGGEDLAKGTFGEKVPAKKFFSSLQWSKNNSGSKSAQHQRENRAVARWLPNFEKSLYGGIMILGIDTAQKDAGGPHFKGPYTSVNGQKYVLMGMTLHDGWGHELYYYSAPPYQSYRVWSAGPDGLTFPPWIPLQSAKVKASKASEWIEDDVVRFDR